MVNSISEWYRPGGREAESEAGELADALTTIVFDGLRSRTPRT